MNIKLIPDIELIDGKIIAVGEEGRIAMDAESARAFAALLNSSADLMEKNERAGAEQERVKRAQQIPVDRSCRVLVSGEPVPEDESHRELKTSGQQKDYVVLCAAERAKGFVRPYRDAYRHLKCGKITTMSRSIAETYARDPGFYSGTFCTTCGSHFPVGENGEFVWYEMDGSIGPKVGA